MFFFLENLENFENFKNFTFFIIFEKTFRIYWLTPGNPMYIASELGTGGKPSTWLDTALGDDTARSVLYPQ